MKLLTLAALVGTVLAFAPEAEAAGRMSRAGAAFGSGARAAGRGTQQAARFVGNEVRNAKVEAGVKLDVLASVTSKETAERLANGWFNTGEGTLGPCKGSAGALEAQVALNANLYTRPDVPGQRPSADTYRRTRTGRGCNSVSDNFGGSAEASLLAARGECAGAYGKIGGAVRGGSVTAAANPCQLEIRADLIAAEVTLATPEATVCGVQGSFEVVGGAAVGVGLGAGRVGTVGGRVRVGPFTIGLGVNAKIVDYAALGNCLMPPWARRLAGAFRRGFVRAMEIQGQAAMNGAVWFTP